MSALSGISEWKKIFFLILLLVAGMFLFSILGSVLVLSIYGFDVLMDVSQSNFNPRSIEAFKWLQTVQSVGMFAGPGIMLAFLYSNTPWKYLGLTKTSGKNMLLTLAVIILAVPGINLLSAINELIPLSDWMLGFETNAEMMLNAFLSHSTPLGFWVNVLIICIIPAFGEEFVFRGLIQKHFINITKSAVWGVIIASAIFSAFHLQFRGFIPRFALGALLGFLYVRSNSIWLPIIAHAANNFFSILVFRLMEKGIVGDQFESIGTFDYLWITGIASIALVIFVMYKIKGKAQSDELEAEQQPQVLE